MAVAKATMTVDPTATVSEDAAPVEGEGTPPSWLLAVISLLPLFPSAPGDVMVSLPEEPDPRPTDPARSTLPSVDDVEAPSVDDELLPLLEDEPSSEEDELEEAEEFPDEDPPTDPLLDVDEDEELLEDPSHDGSWQLPRSRPLSADRMAAHDSTSQSLAPLSPAVAAVGSAVMLKPVAYVHAGRLFSTVEMTPEFAMDVAILVGSQALSAFTEATKASRAKMAVWRRAIVGCQGVGGSERVGLPGARQIGL